jgi:hypothetical protein
MLKKSIIPIVAIIYVLLIHFKFEYADYYFYISLTILIPILILRLIKLRKDDSQNGTNTFLTPVINMLLLSIILLIAFFFI